jgi:nucleoside-diphosphate-sugar epimerase
VSAPDRESPPRIAAVTGGAGAVGGAIVAALQALGHRVVVIDRDADISLCAILSCFERSSVAIESDPRQPYPSARTVTAMKRETC